MKILNFTAKEILPALLDRSKSQTIRKAWSDKSLVTIKEKPTKRKFKKLQKILDKCQKKDEIILPPDYKIEPVLKPPRFKIGEEIKLMWEQRSKNREWCAKCLQGDPATMFPNDGCMNCGVGCEDSFKKTLGTAKITEVFEIEMGQNDDNVWARPIEGRSFSFDDLAKRDGFLSAEEMFAWFDKTYNLSSPKKFYVYRWRWLK